MRIESPIDKALRGRPQSVLPEDCHRHQWRWAGYMRICIRCRAGEMRRCHDELRPVVLAPTDTDLKRLSSVTFHFKLV